MNNKEIFYIGDKAIRIILLKAVLGREADVYDSYARYLESIKKNNLIISWRGFKLFGEYDLCFIITRTNFEHDLAYSGTIEGITYSTELLSFIWDNENGDKSKCFDKNCFNQPLICVNILKIEPKSMSQFSDNLSMHSALYDSIRNPENIYMLGSFGWGEIVVLHTSDSFNSIFSNFKRVIKLQKLGFLLKSFSLIGVDFELIKDGTIKTKLKKDRINKESGFSPTLVVSCRPSEITPLWKGLLNQYGGELVNSSPTILYGAYDFSVEIKEGSWGDFIEKLVQFRKKHKGFIFNTSVQIKGMGLKLPSSGRKWIYQYKTIRVSEREVREAKDISQPLKETILSTIYTYNQYLQNELLHDSVEDMIDYVKEMATIAFSRYLRNRQEGNKIDTALLKYLENMPDIIKTGCNQRLGGYFLQEGAEDFSSFKGGKQYLLKALKAFCSDILEGVGIRWPGFVIIGRYNHYCHFYKVISMPVNAALSVDKYFGLFHEMCHVYRFSSSGILDGLENLVDSESAIQGEAFCDLFAYKCGFLCDYDMYKDVLATYLSELLYALGKGEDKIEEYVLRMLVVFYYKMMSEEVDEKSRKIFFEKEIPSIIELITKNNEVANSLHNIIISNIDRYMFFAKEISEYFQLISKKARWDDFYNERRQKLNEDKLRGQVAKIMRGIVVNDVEHPQLVVLSMLKEKVKRGDIPFKAHMAAIQSFINHYYQNSGGGK
jgi:hypothetical protein